MSTDNSLLIPVAAGRKIFHYQIEMIAYNPRPGILPLKLLQKDQQTYLHYQLCSQQSLSAYLRREEAKRIEIIPILLKMTDILLESKNFLLQPESFSLILSHIFLSPDTKEPSLVYLPLQQGTGLAESFRGLITELKLVRPDLISDFWSLDNLLEYFRREYNSLQSLRNYLLQLSVQGQASPRLEQDKPFKLVPVKPNPANNQDESVEIEEAPQELQEIKAIFQDKKKQIKLFLLAQILIVFLLFLCSKMIDLSDGTSTGAVVLLIGAVNVLLIKKILLNDLDKEES